MNTRSSSFRPSLHIDELSLSIPDFGQQTRIRVSRNWKDAKCPKEFPPSGILAEPPDFSLREALLHHFSISPDPTLV